MRLLVDENIPRAVVLGLVAEGHDVTWIREVAPGASDQQVLEMARDESRLLMSFDKDFGELVFRRRLPAPPGVILLRFVPKTPADAAEVIVNALRYRSDWLGHFSVVQTDQIRMTPMPT